MSKEDELVNALIREAHGRDIYEVATVEPEAHYSHYSNRGFADLYVRLKIEEEGKYTEYKDALYEVKSASAVRQATGANEIVRQFNRMCKAFYQDEGRSLPHRVSFTLLFEVHPETVIHVAENLGMYTSVDNGDVFDNRRVDTLQSVVFRDPNSDEKLVERLHGHQGEIPTTPGEWAYGIYKRSPTESETRMKMLAFLENEYGHGYIPDEEDESP